MTFVRFGGKQLTNLGSSCL